jgi:hypothetical protein
VRSAAPDKNVVGCERTNDRPIALLALMLRVRDESVPVNVILCVCECVCVCARALVGFL